MTMPIMLLHKAKKQQSPLKRTGIEMPSLLQCNKKHESEWLQANFLAQTETWVLSSEKRKNKKQRKSNLSNSKEDFIYSFWQKAAKVVSLLVFDVLSHQIYA